jgi:bidirectional [NiFe] hydrogenase diaphorase subunit
MQAALCRDRRPKRAVSSCRVKARDGMIVSTKTPAVRELQRSALELLISNHRVECKHCPANRKCALQDIARFLGVPFRLKHMERLDRRPRKEMAHPVLDYDPGRCVLCGRCIFVCGRHMGSSLLSFTGRGFDTAVDYLGCNDASLLPCHSCLACVEACPVAAIQPKEPMGTRVQPLIAPTNAGAAIKGHAVPTASLIPAFSTVVVKRTGFAVPAKRDGGNLHSGAK